MALMTTDQFKAVAERGVTVLVTFAVARGWIPAGQAADLVALLVAAAAIGYGVYVNRPTSIVQSAAALPQTTVITAPSIAAVTPESNIMSNATNKVVQR